MIRQELQPGEALPLQLKPDPSEWTGNDYIVINRLHGWPLRIRAARLRAASLRFPQARTILRAFP
jgi:hypothetical protein